MSALPRPDVTGPTRVLNDALHDLHHRAGWPSLRTLARETGVSHTTVSKALSAPALPSWGTLELLVEAMDGDTHAFHQLWLAASTPTNGDGPPAAGIAGRRSELDVVRRHLETGPGLLLVTGEAGIGKTTLVRAATPSDGTSVVAGRCLPLATTIPLLPFADLLRGLQARDGDLDTVLDQCPAFVSAALSPLLPSAGGRTPLTEVGDRWAHRRLLSAVIDVLAALARLRPTAIVIEDLQWADDDTLDLIEQMMHATDLSMVATWRTEDREVPDDRGDWLRRVQRSARTVALAPLGLDDTIDQLRGLLPGIDDADARRIHARSGGQPLFTDHLARETAGEPSTFLTDLLDSRVGRLEGDTWRTTALLGIADRPLAETTLRRATGLGEGPLTASLRDLQQRGLLDSHRQALALRHPLLAEAVQRRLFSHEAGSFHAALAAALANEPGVEPVEVALHWQAASNPTQELVWRIRAARATESRFAGSQAADHWLRVLDLWPPGSASAGDPPIRRYEALAGAAQQLDLGGRPTAAVPLLEDALASVNEFEVVERAGLLRLLARLNSTQFNTEGTGLALIEESIALFRTVPPSPGLAVALNWKSVELEWHGRREEAMAAITEAAEVAASAGNLPLERSVRAQYAWQLAVSGDEGAVGEIEALRANLPEGTEPERHLSFAVRHTDILLMACRPASDVAAAASRELELAREWGLRDHRVEILKGNVAQAWRRSGQIATALQVVREDTAVEDPGDRPPILHTERAILELLQGNVEGAQWRLARLSPGRHEFMGGFVAEARMFRDVWMGDPGAAFHTFGVLIESRHDELSPGTVGDLLVLAARAAADKAAGASAAERSGARDRLHALRAQLHHDPYDAPAVRADRAAGPQWSAETSRLLGEDTVDSWLPAVQTWDSLARPHDAAYCRWRAAQVAIRGGQGTVAARLLKRAATDAREHVPLSRAIDATVAITP